MVALAAAATLAAAVAAPAHAAFPQTPPNDPLFDGTIGYGLLRDFVVVFNYPERKIAFLDP